MNTTAVNNNQAQETNPFEQSFSTVSPKNNEYNQQKAPDGIIDVWVSDTSSYSYNSVNNDAYSVSDHQATSEDSSDDTFNVNNTTNFEFEQQRPKRHINSGDMQNNSYQAQFVNNNKSGKGSIKKRTRTVKLPEDEEKRKNFLERNRLAALKCRQRKKQWLSNLQARVEYLANDNDQLQMETEALRKQIIDLKTLLVGHKDCPQYNAALNKNPAMQHQSIYHHDFSMN